MIVEGIDLVGIAENYGYDAMSEKGRAFLRSVGEIATKPGMTLAMALAIALACEFED